MAAPSYPVEVRPDPLDNTIATRAVKALADYAPGWVLCAVVSGVAIAINEVELAIFHRAWLESLVLAIVIGVMVRSLVPLTDHFDRGITFCAKTVLEVAVMLLGASVSVGAVLSQGMTLLAAIVVIVALAILLGYRVGRLLGLHRELALLVACGNAICGNSAIAATAPVIDANGRDVAASIAFTAVLGVVVVLLLPVFGALVDLSPRAYGVFAGLTVYAVPQVLAATAPVSALSVQVGTLVKLVREESREQRPARDLVLARLLEVLLIEALRSTNAAAETAGLVRGLADTRLSVALRQMHESPEKPWTVAQLATAAALSRSAFFDRFSRIVGVAPMEYLLSWRMALAKNMLRQKGGGVAKVAERVGYGSASAFSVAFTRYVGLPPTQYANGQAISEGA